MARGQAPAPSMLVETMFVVLAGCVVVLHASASALVLVYSVAQADLWRRSLRGDPPRATTTDRPWVTVQLPLRNERTVVRELLDSIMALSWPIDRLHLQILDDSDDETTALCERACEVWRQRGGSVELVRRGDRTGYKAGALAHGMNTAKGDFIAILDADFRPNSDFLERTVSVLAADEGLALVQARWGHLNANDSLYTRAQAFHLDAHFTIEQRARSSEPLLMGFNGTAGVWRRAAIQEAGGWSADTLTEDLDLAFRAQLAGWSVAYVDGVEAPAELPADVRAIRTQQHRWMKGGAQVGRKMLGTLWRSERSLAGKLQGSVHLLGGTVFGAVTILLLTTPVLGFLTARHPWMETGLMPGARALQASLVVLSVFYATMCVRRQGWSGVGRFFRDFLPFLALSSGLAVHNAVAVAEGWLGHESPFVRTPKVGDGSALYAPLRAGPIVWVEMALAIWAMVGLAWAVLNGQWVLAGFLFTQALGCATVAIGGLR